MKVSVRRGDLADVASLRKLFAVPGRPAIRDPAVMANGTVKFFRPDKGYGAITSPDLPDGFDAWVHFSAIEMDGNRSLDPGDLVEFDYEPAQQDIVSDIQQMRKTKSSRLRAGDVATAKDRARSVRESAVEPAR